MIPIAKPCLNGNEKKYINECIDTGWISSTGEFVKQFEILNSSFYGTKYAVAVSNGTVALHLALNALGIKEGDEVIIPDFTFAATANAVLYMKATPVLCDVDIDTWTIDVKKIEELITDKTKAIIPVHLYGQSCDMAEISRISKKYNLYVIEDCAEAHGAEYEGSKVGSFGDISCFSFYGNKIITTGEGGICLTNSSKLDTQMRILRDHGMSKTKRYWHDVVGYNYRMTNMQAAIGVAQMEQIEDILRNREHICELYDKYFEHSNRIQFRKRNELYKNVNWLYSLVFKNIDSSRIEEIQNELKQKGVDSRPLFYPLHKMSLYSEYKRSTLNNSIHIADFGLSLPTFNELKNSQIEYIAKTLLAILEKNK